MGLYSTIPSTLLGTLPTVSGVNGAYPTCMTVDTNGNIYVMYTVYDTIPVGWSSPTMHLEMYKSTNGGSTWNEIDSANRPDVSYSNDSFPTTDQYRMFPRRYIASTKRLVSAQGGEDSWGSGYGRIQWKFAVFNTASFTSKPDQWEPLYKRNNSTGPVYYGATSAENRGQVYPSIKPNGDVVCLFEIGQYAQPYYSARPYVMALSGSTWSNWGQLVNDDGGYYAYIPGLCVSDGNNNTTFAWRKYDNSTGADSGIIYWETWDSSYTPISSQSASLADNSSITFLNRGTIYDDNYRQDAILYDGSEYIPALCQYKSDYSNDWRYYHLHTSGSIHEDNIGSYAETGRTLTSWTVVDHLQDGADNVAFMNLLYKIGATTYYSALLNLYDGSDWTTLRTPEGSTSTFTVSCSILSNHWAYYVGTSGSNKGVFRSPLGSFAKPAAVSIGLDTVAPTVVWIALEAHPIGDALTGGWKSHDNSAVDLYTRIDEYSASNADYIGHESGGGNTYRAKLSSISPPDDLDNWYLGFSYWKSGTLERQCNLLVRLCTSGSTAATWTLTDIPDAVTSGQVQLTGAQAASISDWTDLYIEFEAVYP